MTEITRGELFARALQAEGIVADARSRRRGCRTRSREVAVATINPVRVEEPSSEEPTRKR